MTLVSTPPDAKEKSLGLRTHSSGWHCLSLGPTQPTMAKRIQPLSWEKRFPNPAQSPEFTASSVPALVRPPSLQHTPPSPHIKLSFQWEEQRVALVTSWSCHMSSLKTQAHPGLLAQALLPLKQGSDTWEEGRWIEDTRKPG